MDLGLGALLQPALRSPLAARLRSLRAGRGLPVVERLGFAPAALECPGPPGSQQSRRGRVHTAATAGWRSLRGPFHLHGHIVFDHCTIFLSIVGSALC
jgi:hypothetical protein